MSDPSQPPAWRGGAAQLSLPIRVERGAGIATILVLWFQVGLWGMAAVRYAVNRRRLRSGTPDPALSGSMEIVIFVAGLVVWTTAFLFALDKPFAVGDALVIDDFNGTVEHIGVKSTRLRERRSAFELTVTYDTSPDVLRAIPQSVRAIIESQPNTRFDRCHLMTCAPTGPAFEIVYFVTVPEYSVYADLQQAINIATLERFRMLGVQFATPVLAPTPTYPKAPEHSLAEVTPPIPVASGALPVALPPAAAAACS
ncbi:MAG: mechanosensitive ion channel family protein [Steroidobacteraceae bacterium]